MSVVIVVVIVDREVRALGKTLNGLGGRHNTEVELEHERHNFDSVVSFGTSVVWSFRVWSRTAVFHSRSLDPGSFLQRFLLSFRVLLCASSLHSA